MTLEAGEMEDGPSILDEVNGKRLLGEHGERKKTCNIR